MDFPYSSSTYDRSSHRWPSHPEVCGPPPRWSSDLNHLDWRTEYGLRRDRERKCGREHSYPYCESPCWVSETGWLSSGVLAQCQQTYEDLVLLPCQQVNRLVAGFAGHTIDDDLFKLVGNLWRTKHRHHSGEWSHQVF